MSIQHLHYALKDIDTASQVLSIKNSTFFKRSIARVIAIRIDDFIKLGFLTNKQSENKKAIKDEINALQDLYAAHFKLQRDKYSAHFQHLDFGQRLQNWSDINADKASFFTEIPIDIYRRFNTATGYIPYTPAATTASTISIIEAVNEEFDLEPHPNLSSDILSLTRPNSGGMLNFSMIHTKAGVLKSLELLIDYEWAMIDRLRENRDTLRFFIKLLVIDLLSYTDNYFTRTDITNASPQYEEGFDYYIASNVSDGAKEGNEIITQFKSNFKLDDHVSELRAVRNKACGHIDTTLTVSQLNALIDDFDMVKFHDFYQRLKAMFRSVCHSTFYLTQYLMDPFDKLHNVEKMVGLEVSSFDGKPFAESPSRYKSPNDDEQYEQQYRQWLATGDNSVRSYFWNCFINSDVIERVEIVIPHPLGGESYRYHDFRKAHQFFEEKLISESVAISDKVAIIELFLQCRSGDPETLAYILDKTYPNDLNLCAYYIRALGKLSDERSKETLQRCIDVYNTTNLQGKCLAVRALFTIDLNARRSTTGKHNTDISNYSTHIKSILNSSTIPFEKLSLSLMLLSEYIFGRHYLSNTLDQFYKEYLVDCFIESSARFLAPVLLLEDDKLRSTEIMELVKVNRFTTLVGSYSEFIEDKGCLNEATLLRTLVADGYILFSTNDNQELHNLSVIYFKIGDIETAINIAQSLTQKNAHKADFNYLLLDLYRHDKKYKTEFDKLRSKVLATFNLNDEERRDFEGITMNNDNNDILL